MTPIVIPAYQPGPPLVRVVEELRTLTGAPVVVINDGSDESCLEFFAAVARVPGVTVLRHAINLGKGAALKTGLNHALCEWPDLTGVVTADADGQHLPADILRVASRLEREPESLVLGARRFAGEVPLRSLVGNRLTVGVMRILTGQKLSDTQTGLRGIPRRLMSHLLLLTSGGYEFELDMLLACKHRGISIVDEPIATVYLDDNRSSHFNPLTDSLKIYFTLVRFGAISLASTLIDNAVFYLAILAGSFIWQAQLSARIVSLLFNYNMVRKAVFLSRQEVTATFPRYLALVVASGTTSYFLLGFLHENAGFSIMLAKVTAEVILFFVNFMVQRDFIFVRRTELSTATDWDGYYQRTPWLASLTRRYTARTLVRLMRRLGGGRRIVELGGANSCFCAAVFNAFEPVSYHVIDNNEDGLSRLAPRNPRFAGLSWTYGDVLHLAPAPSADIVYSVGLIEHFNVVDTERAVHAHFCLVRDGGHVIISFPTPTWLYRLSRSVAELLGLWKFPDERPLSRDEVARVMAQHGPIVWEKTLWPLVLTQHMIAVRKTLPGPAAS